MRHLAEFLITPAYINYFKKYDKKLSKNLVKRCIVEPFTSKLMKSATSYPPAPQDSTEVDARSNPESLEDRDD